LKGLGTHVEQSGGVQRIARKIMIDTNPARALHVAEQVAKMCDFLESSVIRTAIDNRVPVSMPRAPGALGFNIPLWVGLGTVGLWAGLDAFAKRAGLPKTQCGSCKSWNCIRARFAQHVQGNEDQALGELEDLRHLYAHNYAGEADDAYFDHKQRHVLERDVSAQLTCGAVFDGRGVRLDLPHLRAYGRTVQSVLMRFR
jgi:hypothetical protein